MSLYFNTLQQLGSTSQRKAKGRVSSLSSISKQLFKAHYDGYHPRVARQLATALKRYINTRPKHERKSQEFIGEIRRKILCLHEYNVQIAKVKFKYPKSEQFDLLLIQYVELECGLLYDTYREVDKEFENSVTQRVLRLLRIILHDALQNGDASLKATSKACDKALLKLFANVRADCVSENKLVANTIIKLLDRLGLLDEVNKLKGKNIPFHQDTFLKDPLVSTIRQNLETSDYNSDDDSDDEIETIPIVLDDIFGSSSQKTQPFLTNYDARFPKISESSLPRHFEYELGKNNLTNSYKTKYDKENHNSCIQSSTNSKNYVEDFSNFQSNTMKPLTISGLKNSSETLQEAPVFFDKTTDVLSDKNRFSPLVSKSISESAEDIGHFFHSSNKIKTQEKALTDSYTSRSTGYYPPEVTTTHAQVAQTNKENFSNLTDVELSEKRGFDEGVEDFQQRFVKTEIHESPKSISTPKVQIASLTTNSDKKLPTESFTPESRQIANSSEITDKCSASNIFNTNITIDVDALPDSNRMPVRENINSGIVTIEIDDDDDDYDNSGVSSTNSNLLQLNEIKLEENEENQSPNFPAPNSDDNYQNLLNPGKSSRNSDSAGFNGLTSNSNGNCVEEMEALAIVISDSEDEACDVTPELNDNKSIHHKTEEIEVPNEDLTVSRETETEINIFPQKRDGSKHEEEIDQRSITVDDSVELVSTHDVIVESVSNSTALVDDGISENVNEERDQNIDVDKEQSDEEIQFVHTEKVMVEDTVRSEDSTAYVEEDIATTERSISQEDFHVDSTLRKEDSTICERDVQVLDSNTYEQEPGTPKVNNGEMQEIEKVDDDLNTEIVESTDTEVHTTQDTQTTDFSTYCSVPLESLETEIISEDQELVIGEVSEKTGNETDHIINNSVENKFIQEELAIEEEYTEKSVVSEPSSAVINEILAHTMDSSAVEEKTEKSFEESRLSELSKETTSIALCEVVGSPEEDQEDFEKTEQIHENSQDSNTRESPVGVESVSQELPVDSSYPEPQNSIERSNEYSDSRKSEESLDVTEKCEEGNDGPLVEMVASFQESNQIVNPECDTSNVDDFSAQDTETIQTSGDLSSVAQNETAIDSQQLDETVTVTDAGNETVIAEDTVCEVANVELTESEPIESKTSSIELENNVEKQTLEASCASVDDLEDKELKSPGLHKTQPITEAKNVEQTSELIYSDVQVEIVAEQHIAIEGSVESVEDVNILEKLSSNEIEKDTDDKTQTGEVSEVSIDKNISEKEILTDSVTTTDDFNTQLVTWQNVEPIETETSKEVGLPCDEAVQLDQVQHSLPSYGAENQQPPVLNLQISQSEEGVVDVVTSHVQIQQPITGLVENTALQPMSFYTMPSIAEVPYNEYSSEKKVGGDLELLANIAANQKTLAVKTDSEKETLDVNSDVEMNSKLKILQTTPKRRRSKVKFESKKKTARETLPRAVKQLQRKNLFNQKSNLEEPENKRITRNKAVKPKIDTNVLKETQKPKPVKTEDSKYKPHDFISMENSILPARTNNVYAQKIDANTTSEDSNDSCASTLFIDLGESLKHSEKAVKSVYDEDTVCDMLEFITTEVKEAICISIPENEGNCVTDSFHILKQMEEFVDTDRQEVAGKVHEDQELESSVVASKEINSEIEHTETPLLTNNTDENLKAKTAKTTDHSIENILNISPNIEGKVVDHTFSDVIEVNEKHTANSPTTEKEVPRLPIHVNSKTTDGARSSGKASDVPNEVKQEGLGVQENSKKHTTTETEVPMLPIPMNSEMTDETRSSEKVLDVSNEVEHKGLEVQENFSPILCERSLTCVGNSEIITSVCKSLEDEKITLQQKEDISLQPENLTIDNNVPVPRQDENCEKTFKTKAAVKSYDDKLQPNPYVLLQSYNATTALSKTDMGVRTRSRCKSSEEACKQNISSDRSRSASIDCSSLSLSTYSHDSSLNSDLDRSCEENEIIVTETQSEVTASSLSGIGDLTKNTDSRESSEKAEVSGAVVAEIVDDVSSKTLNDSQDVCMDNKNDMDLKETQKIENIEETQQVKNTKEAQVENIEETQQVETTKEAQQVENVEETQVESIKETQVENTKETQIENTKETQYVESVKETQVENTKETQIENTKETQHVESVKETVVEMSKMEVVSLASEIQNVTVSITETAKEVSITTSESSDKNLECQSSKEIINIPIKGFTTKKHSDKTTKSSRTSDQAKGRSLENTIKKMKERAKLSSTQSLKETEDKTHSSSAAEKATSSQVCDIHVTNEKVDVEKKHHKKVVSVESKQKPSETHKKEESRHKRRRSRSSSKSRTTDKKPEQTVDKHKSINKSSPSRSSSKSSEKHSKHHSDGENDHKRRSKSRSLDKDKTNQATEESIKLSKRRSRSSSKSLDEKSKHTSSDRSSSKVKSSDNKEKSAADDKDHHKKRRSKSPSKSKPHDGKMKLNHSEKKKSTEKEKVKEKTEDKKNASDVVKIENKSKAKSDENMDPQNDKIVNTEKQNKSNDENILKLDNKSSRSRSKRHKLQENLKKSNEEEDKLSHKQISSHRSKSHNSVKTTENKTNEKEKHRDAHKSKSKEKENHTKLTFNNDKHSEVHKKNDHLKNDKSRRSHSKEKTKSESSSRNDKREKTPKERIKEDTKKVGESIEEHKEVPIPVAKDAATEKEDKKVDKPSTHSVKENDSIEEHKEEPIPVAKDATKVKEDNKVDKPSTHYVKENDSIEEHKEVPIPITKDATKEKEDNEVDKPPSHYVKEDLVPETKDGNIMIEDKIESLNDTSDYLSKKSVTAGAEVTEKKRTPTIDIPKKRKYDPSLENDAAIKDVPEVKIPKISSDNETQTGVSSSMTFNVNVESDIQQKITVHSEEPSLTVPLTTETIEVKQVAVLGAQSQSLWLETGKNTNTLDTSTTVDLSYENFTNGIKISSCAIEKIPEPKNAEVEIVDLSLPPTSIEAQEDTTVTDDKLGASEISTNVDLQCKEVLQPSELSVDVVKYETALNEKDIKETASISAPLKVLLNENIPIPTSEPVFIDTVFSSTTDINVQILPPPIDSTVKHLTDQGLDMATIAASVTVTSVSMPCDVTTSVTIDNGPSCSTASIRGKTCLFPLNKEAEAESRENINTSNLFHTSLGLNISPTKLPLGANQSLDFNLPATSLPEISNSMNLVQTLGTSTINFEVPDTTEIDIQQTNKQSSFGGNFVPRVTGISCFMEKESPADHNYTLSDPLVGGNNEDRNILTTTGLSLSNSPEEFQLNESHLEDLSFNENNFIENGTLEELGLLLPCKKEKQDFDNIIDDGNDGNDGIPKPEDIQNRIKQLNMLADIAQSDQPKTVSVDSATDHGNNADRSVSLGIDYAVSELLFLGGGEGTSQTNSFSALPDIDNINIIESNDSSEHPSKQTLEDTVTETSGDGYNGLAGPPDTYSSSMEIDITKKVVVEPVEQCSITSFDQLKKDYINETSSKEAEKSKPINKSKTPHSHRTVNFATFLESVKRDANKNENKAKDEIENYFMRRHNRTPVVPSKKKNTSHQHQTKSPPDTKKSDVLFFDTNNKSQNSSEHGKEGRIRVKTDLIEPTEEVKTQPSNDSLEYINEHDQNIASEVVLPFSKPSPSESKSESPLKKSSETAAKVDPATSKHARFDKMGKDYIMENILNACTDGKVHKSPIPEKSVKKPDSLDLTKKRKISSDSEIKREDKRHKKLDDESDKARTSSEHDKTHAKKTDNSNSKQPPPSSDDIFDKLVREGPINKVFAQKMTEQQTTTKKDSSINVETQKNRGYFTTSANAVKREGNLDLHKNRGYFTDTANAKKESGQMNIKPELLKNRGYSTVPENYKKDKNALAPSTSLQLHDSRHRDIARFPREQKKFGYFTSNSNSHLDRKYAEKRHTSVPTTDTSPKRLMRTSGSTYNSKSDPCTTRDHKSRDRRMSSEHPNNIYHHPANQQEDDKFSWIDRFSGTGLFDTPSDLFMPQGGKREDSSSRK